jgi:hypothetical protein
MRFIELSLSTDSLLGVVARGGIEPPTRGFSVRRSPRFDASKPKTGKGFPARRPNRPARPSPCRTRTVEDRPGSPSLDPVQRLSRIATELFPNLAPNGALRRAVPISAYRVTSRV